MEGMNAWDIAILVGAVYLSVILLVRLMRQRRNQLIEELRGQIVIEQARRREAERAERRRRRSEAAAAAGQPVD